MALNFNKIGRPLCVMLPANKVISIDTNDDPEVQKKFVDIVAPEGQMFQLIPNYESERTCIFIYGPSGSGKSTYIGKYIQQYLKYYKKNKVYCFSAVEQDDALDKHCVRIKINDNLIEDPIDVKEFSNSLVIFDDIDVLDKKHKTAVYDILNKILKIGRHNNISICIANHNPTEGAGKNGTKTILFESHVIIFPCVSGGRANKYLQMEYLDLDKATLAKIKTQKSRFCAVFNTYPKICLTDKSIWII